MNNEVLGQFITFILIAIFVFEVLNWFLAVMDKEEEDAFWHKYILIIICIIIFIWLMILKLFILATVPILLGIGIFYYL